MDLRQVKTNSDISIWDWSFCLFPYDRPDRPELSQSFQNTGMLKLSGRPYWNTFRTIVNDPDDQDDRDRLDGTDFPPDDRGDRKKSEAIKWKL